MLTPITYPFCVSYKAIARGSGSTVQGYYNTLEAAESAASAFLRQYPTQYDIYISKPFLEIKLTNPPIEKQELTEYWGAEDNK